MKQIGVYAEVGIKFVKETMKCCKAALEQGFNPCIVRKCQVIIQSKQGKHETNKLMRCWIGSHLLEENTIFTDGCADTSIKNILLKRAYNALGKRGKDFLMSQLVCTHQDRKAGTLR